VDGNAPRLPEYARTLRQSVFVPTIVLQRILEAAMNATELLRAEHRDLVELISELEFEQDSEEESRDLSRFNELKDALLLHALIEEEVLYPALEEFDETRELAHDAYMDHQQIDDALTELFERLSRNFTNQFATLTDLIERHFDHEETKLFPYAEELIGNARLEEMGRRMEEIRNERMTASGHRRM
jgi:hemerythrin superfamily protein